MRYANRLTQPNGIIILRQLNNGVWMFVFPRLTEPVHELLAEAIDSMDSDSRTAKAKFTKLLRNYPEYLDAYHHQALTWHRQGKLDQAGELWRQGVDFAVRLFPSNFSIKRDKLIWGFVENRPFLRLYHSHGLSLLRQGKIEEALEVFENLLSLNPEDNQGARALAVKCHFELQNPTAVVKICNRFPDDALEDLLYGRVLALLQLDDLPKASKALSHANQVLPRVASELMQPAHKRPKDYDEATVTCGSAGQAFGYWKEFGKFWSATPGAIDFVRGHLQGGRKGR